MVSQRIIGTAEGDETNFRLDPPGEGRLRVLPLGGVGEFGKNCLALECGRDLIAIDCGQKFPDDHMLGIDMVIPDLSYLLHHIDRLRGIVLTHGHEDHIGAMAFLIRQMGSLRVPIYGSTLTLSLVCARFDELDLDHRPLLVEVKAGEKVRLGAFEIEFLPVMHSMPDAFALSINTSLGRIIHTGDFKLEAANGREEPDGKPFLDAAAAGETLLMLADSTNVDREGMSPTEARVKEGLRPVIEGAPASVVLACFSSSLYRVQSALELAREFGRKVAICGTSLERNFIIGTDLGLLDYPPHLVRPLHEIVRMPPDERMILMTGTQGEPLSALSRLSLNSLKGYRIQPEDLVVFSSRIIPGNERAIYRMINNFYRHGARVVTERDAMVHGSGHAYRAEMRLLLEKLQPQYLIPIHGELRQLIGHRDLGVECGMARENIMVLENGEMLEFGNGAPVTQRTEWAGQVLVDGRMMEGVEEVVLRDRKHLSEDGMLTVVLVIDSATHRIVAGPDIVSRGFVCMDENASLIEDCKRVVAEAFEESDLDNQEQWDVVKVAVRKALRRFLREATDRYPLILPVILEM